MENNSIIVLMHIQTSIAFGRPADATILLFWNKKNKSGDKQKALCTTRWPKILQWSTLCQTTIFLCLISSLCLLLCAWFSLIYCYAKYLHDHRWEVFFQLQFLFFLFHCPVPGPIFEQQHTRLFRRLPFHGLPPLFKTWICQKIPAARATRGGLCLVGEGKFLQYSTVKYIYHQYSQGVSAQSLRVSLEKTFSYSTKFPMVGFTLLSTVFGTVSIWIGHSMIEGISQSLPVAIKKRALMSQ